MYHLFYVVGIVPFLSPFLENIIRQMLEMLINKAFLGESISPIFSSYKWERDVINGVPFCGV